MCSLFQKTTFYFTSHVNRLVGTRTRKANILCQNSVIGGLFIFLNLAPQNRDIDCVNTDKIPQHAKSDLGLIFAFSTE